jgi:hypothetical protein
MRHWLLAEAPLSDLRAQTQRPKRLVGGSAVPLSALKAPPCGCLSQHWCMSGAGYLGTCRVRPGRNETLLSSKAGAPHPIPEAIYSSVMI